MRRAAPVLPHRRAIGLAVLLHALVAAALVGVGPATRPVSDDPVVLEVAFEPPPALPDTPQSEPPAPDPPASEPPEQPAPAMPSVDPTPSTTDVEVAAIVPDAPPPPPAPEPMPEPSVPSPVPVPDEPPTPSVPSRPEPEALTAPPVIPPSPVATVPPPRPPEPPRPPPTRLAPPSFTPRHLAPRPAPPSEPISSPTQSTHVTLTPTVDLIDYRRIVAAALNRAKSYPPAARRRVLEGRVVIGITIESDGTVTNPTIETSSGHSLLDTDALATAGRLALPPPPAGRVTLQLALSYRLTE